MSYTDPTDRSTSRQIQIYQGAIFISPLLLGNHSGLCIQLINIQPFSDPNTYCKTSIFVICTYRFAVHLYDLPQFLGPISQSWFSHQLHGLYVQEECSSVIQMYTHGLSQETMFFSNMRMKIQLHSPLLNLLFPKCIWDTGPCVGLVLSFGGPWL